MAIQTKAQPVFKPIFSMECPQDFTSMVMEPQLSMLDAVVSGTSAERERGGERGAATNGRDLEAGAKDRIAIAAAAPSKERKDGGVLQDMLNGDKTTGYFFNLVLHKVLLVS